MRPRARVRTLTLPPIGGGALGAFFATLLFSLGKPPEGDDLAAREEAAAARVKRPDDLVSDLTDQFWERLRLFATRRLRDVALAEDVAQEVLRRALEALREGRVEKPEALPAFLFQTARHICMQRARSFGREARALQKMAPADESSSEPDPLHGLISRERGEEVHAALARMEKDDRDLLGMCYGLALDTDEIARRLGINPGAVRVRKHRALARLAALLGVTKAPKRELS